jgi:uncharacterized membrane protein YkoI
MMKKIIVALVVVLAISGLVFATLGNSGSKNITNNSTNNTSGPEKQGTLPSNYTTHNSTQTQISSAEAQKIASKYIQVSGATAGTPKLMKQDNKMVYIVPIIKNGTNVGEIYIDSITGKNLGGAGGAP